MIRPDVCRSCSEEVTPEFEPLRWIHTHSGDTYCGTGDGATAYPKTDERLAQWHETVRQRREREAEK